MNAIAHELQVSTWLNTDRPLSLAQLRGKVVAIYAFQMLCPGCVSHGIPQAKTIRATFAEQDVAVLGLHSVFEHHDVMTPRALATFLHEYRVQFPVAVDQPSAAGPIPLTMAQYGLRGTPTLLLIDRAGRLRLSHFGRAEDMQVGALIGGLVAEAPPALAAAVADHAAAMAPAHQVACDDTGCTIG